MSWMEWFLWVCLAFLSGSLPFSVWLARIAGKDPRQVGDGNPGATNALKAAGKGVGLAALMLDVSKAAAPVGLAYQVYNLRGFGMVVIALAPMIGHAYSPFLKFKGGKALAAALGVWIGLTWWDVPLVILINITLWFLLLRNSLRAILITLLAVALYLIFQRPDPLFFWIFSLQSALVLWKHRHEMLKHTQ